MVGGPGPVVPFDEVSRGGRGDVADGRPSWLEFVGERGLGEQRVDGFVGCLAAAVAEDPRRDARGTAPQIARVVAWKWWSGCVEFGWHRKVEALHQVRERIEAHAQPVPRRGFSHPVEVRRRVGWEEHRKFFEVLLKTGG